MVLEDWDVFTVGDFADFLDGIDGVEGACKQFANRIRSDELVVAVRATVLTRVDRVVEYSSNQQNRHYSV